MCTMWVDGFNGVAHHLARNIDFAIVAAVAPAALRAHARTRGWNRLRLLSAGDSTFKYDLSSDEEGGSQDAVLSVFVRDDNGNVRHTTLERQPPDLCRRTRTSHRRLVHDLERPGSDATGSCRPVFLTRLRRLITPRNPQKILKIC